MPPRETSLYLDTARFGLASRATARALQDLVRLSAKEGLSLRFEDILRDGIAAAGSAAESYPGLAEWRGVEGLKVSLRIATGVGPEAPVFLSNTSASLVRFSARAVFRRSACVLTSDLLWPSWTHALKEEARRTRARYLVVPLREAVFGERISSEELIERIAQVYRREGADALVLPLVTQDGVRLPLRRLYQALSALEPPRCVLVDAAQAIGHLGVEEELLVADLALFGTHKWIRAQRPFRVAVAPRARSQAFLEELHRETHDSCESSDPLSSLLKRLESSRMSLALETTELGGLFSAQAALASSAKLSEDEVLTRARTLEDCARAASWSPWSLAPELRSGIVLVSKASLAGEGAMELRRRLQDEGVSASCYSGGAARLSIPLGDWGRDEAKQLERALWHAGR